MRLVIVDPTTPKPYSLKTLKQDPLGGAEASVVRIAERLDATVIQHNRSTNEGRYRSSGNSIDPTHLVILRDPAYAVQLFVKYSKTKKFLWMHDLCGPGTEPGKDLTDHASALAELDVTIVCVSDFQAAEACRNFCSLPEIRRPHVKRVYLPVDVTDGESPATGFDNNKLVFFSSPHKGLDFALEVFAHLHHINDKLRLYVANPGYRLKELSKRAGVINLGSLPHHVVIEHMSNAMCTFYPNYVYPETFGLVLAESNALGTPVMTHPIGAATEILVGEEQFVAIPNTRFIADQVYRHFPLVRGYGERFLARIGCFSTYAQKIHAWQSGARPRVCGRVEFSFPSVMASWHQLLDS